MAYQEQDANGKLWVTKLTANDSSAKETLGAKRELEDGRTYRYIKMTGSAGALGEVLMPATKVTVTTATSADGIGPDGATTTIVTDTDASWTVDAYIGWYYQNGGSTGTTEPLKIVGNTATTLTLEKSIITDCSAEAGEILSATNAGILSAAGDLDVACVGVCIGTLTENYYGWAQISGPAAVLSHAISEGESICPGGAAAGEAIAADNDADNNVIGVCISASGTDEFTFADLRIA